MVRLNIPAIFTGSVRDGESLASHVSTILDTDGVSSSTLGILFWKPHDTGTRNSTLFASDRVATQRAALGSMLFFRHPDFTGQAVRRMGVESCKPKERASMVAIAVLSVDTTDRDHTVLHPVPVSRFARILGRRVDRLPATRVSDTRSVRRTVTRSLF